MRRCREIKRDQGCKADWGKLATRLRHGFERWSLSEGKRHASAPACWHRIAVFALLPPRLGLRWSRGITCGFADWAAARLTRRRYIFRTPVVEIAVGPHAKKLGDSNSKPNQMPPHLKPDFGKALRANLTVRLSWSRNTDLPFWQRRAKGGYTSFGRPALRQGVVLESICRSHRKQAFNCYRLSNKTGACC